jgi:hypothetical protein
MGEALTITLPAEAGEELLAEARSAGQTAKQFLAELLRRRAVVRRLREVQATLQPVAREGGWNSEEDILREGS